MPDGPELVYAPTPQEEVRVRRVPSVTARPPVAENPRASRRVVRPQVPSFARVPASISPATAQDHEREAEELAGAWVADSLEHLDLTGIRVHHGPLSAALTAAHGAEAVTVGTDIHLAPDHAPLDSREGRHLLAHELVHVWQQSAGRAPSGRHQARRKKRARPKVTFKDAVESPNPFRKAKG